MPQRLFGVDIGAYSVKGVLVEDSMRGFRVESVREERVADGPPETRKTRVMEALQILLGSPPTKVDAFVAALPLDVATTRFVTLPYADPKKIAQTLPGELADTLPFDIEDAAFGHSIERKLEDGSTVNLAAVAQISKVKEFLALLSSGGVDPRYLGVDALQLYNLYTHFLRTDASKAEAPGQSSAEAGTFIQPAPGGPPSARLVVDIGHERTLFLAASDEGIAHARVVRTGGRAVTEAVAAGSKLPYAEAEELKHLDGFVASSRHPASTEDAQRMSDWVAKGSADLFRELRRTLQTIRAEKRAIVTRIDLVGGGSRIRNLAHRIAEEVNVPVAHGLAVEQIVERHVDGARRPAFALALAAALRAVGDERVSTIDLRTADLAFAGQMVHLKERIPFMLGAAAAVVVLLLANTAASYHQAIQREKELDRQFCEITKTTVGREICEPKEALAAMQKPASELGNVKLPERSALNIAAELSSRVPPGTEVSIEELDISPERAKISGETASFDAVDSLVSEFAKDDCYSDIKKGKLQKKAGGEKIEFQLTMTMECS